MPYFLVVEDRRGPRKSHATLEIARTEADRLRKQKQNLGRKVFLLEQIEVIAAQEPRKKLTLKPKAPESVSTAS